MPNDESVPASFAYANDCHYRWPGQTWGSTAGGAYKPFIQAGTADCPWYSAGTFDRFCYYMSTHGTWYASWPTARIAHSSATRSYEYSHHSGSTYYCKFDGTIVNSLVVDQGTTSGARLWSLGEVNYESKTPVATYFAINPHVVAFRL
jgi:hypothetical protein